MDIQTIGRYQIKSQIGRGGMAVVYAAHDPLFNRDVALKMLPAEMLHDPTFRMRFEREAKTIAALENPGIVPVYDFGEAEGRPYFVMRLMTGGSLADRIQRGAMTLDQVIEIFSQICPALDDAHAKGIVHRDLKPSNILFDQYGKAYLADFGLVKLTGSNQATLTGTAIVGTPAYMSPEQANGTAAIDGRSDVYSLGVILFEMLSGRVPYNGDTPVTQLMKHVTEPIPNLLALRRDLPPACQAVIARALAKNPDYRFAKAGDLLTALKAAAKAPPASIPTVRPPDSYVPYPTPTVISPTPPPGPPFPTPSPKRKVPAWLWIAAALASVCVVITGIAGGIGAWMYLRPTPTLTAMATVLPPPTVIPPTAAPRLTATPSPLPSPTATPPPSPTPSPTVALPPAVLQKFPKARAVYEDDFSTSISKDRWVYNASYVKLVDGILQFSEKGDWGTLLRTSTPLVEGQGVLVLYRYTQSPVQTEFILDAGGGFNTPGYRRWGLYPQTTPRVSIFEGSKFDGGEFFKGPLEELEQGVWYYTLLILNQQSKYTLTIWEKDNPAQECSYQTTFSESWNGLLWAFSVTVKKGSIEIDSITLLEFK